jgi:tRNA (cmo5U34)-methyltransferase
MARTPLDKKSSIDEIKRRFDGDVERFSNLETGQTATIDAPLTLDLIARAACRCTQPIRKVLDIGCGAGNNALKLAQYAAPFDCDLVDLSGPMLERAHERIRAVNAGTIRLLQGDFRHIELPDQSYDVILAAAVLHHLRDDRDWAAAFEKLFRLTAPGGSVWITDLVSHEAGAVQALMWQRYGDYLCRLGGEACRAKVFDYIEREDSPRPVTYQLDLLRKAGFDEVDLLHKNSCFAAFGAIRKGISGKGKQP